MTALGGLAFGQGQAPATTTPPQGRGGQGGGGRGAGSPANVPAAKLARVSLMTLNFRTHAEVSVDAESEREPDA